jgi:ribosome maturation factor RimP
MEGILETIRNAISKKLDDLDIVVDSITFEREGKYNFLRIVLDKVNGIDLDGIVMATNVINPILDELDLIEDEYILDVLSKERGNE